MKARAPLSSHRLFPAIVALWFTALFGLGCLVLPSALTERIVVATGLPSILPASAPPLGMNARLLLAAGCTLVGALAGFFLAHSIRKIQAPAARAPQQPSRRLRRARLEDSSRRPVYAKDELGTETFDAPIDSTLAMQSFEPEPFAADADDIGEAIEKDNDETQILFGAPVFEDDETYSSPTQYDYEVDEARASDDLPEIELTEADFSILEASETNVEISAHLTDEGQSAAVAASQPQIETFADEPSGETMPDVHLTPNETNARSIQLLMEAPLAELGMVQLVERLGHSLQRRTDRRQPLPQGLAEILGVQPSRPKAATPFQSRESSAASQPVSNGNEASSSRDIPILMRPIPLESDEFYDEDEDDQDGNEQTYSSLIGIRSLRRESPVSEAMEEQAAQPSSSADDALSDDAHKPDRAEAENALRSALATLQKLSGAA